MDIVEALRAKQGEMSQARFAAVLGISEAGLSLIYRRERIVGEATARRIARAYPDLKWLLMGFLMEKEGLYEVTGATEHKSPQNG